MSILPIAVHGEELRVLIVGGGAVASRKIDVLLGAGATVRLIAPNVESSIARRLAAEPRLILHSRRYRAGDVGDAQMVVAATNDRRVNARVAADARAAHRLVLVADRPEEGNCRALAVHRAGALAIGVSAAGVPSVASRVRDALAARFDARYDDAVRRLQLLRRAMLAANRRDDWRAAREALVGADFCSRVESGEFAEQVARWH